MDLLPQPVEAGIGALGIAGSVYALKRHGDAHQAHDADLTDLTLRQDAAAARRTAHFSTEDPVERSVFLGLADDLDADAATAFAKRSKLGRSAMMWDHAGWALMAAGGFLMADALMGMGVLSTASGR